MCLFAIRHAADLGIDAARKSARDMAIRIAQLDRDAERVHSPVPSSTQFYDIGNGNRHPQFQQATGTFTTTTRTKVGAAQESGSAAASGGGGNVSNSGRPPNVPHRSSMPSRGSSPVGGAPGGGGFPGSGPLAATTLAAKVETRKAITLRSPTNEAIPHLAATEMDTTAMAQAAKLGTATRLCYGSSRKRLSEVASEKKIKWKLPRCLVWFSSDPGKSQSETKLLQPVDAEILDSHGPWRKSRISLALSQRSTSSYPLHLQVL